MMDGSSNLLRHVVGESVVSVIALAVARAANAHYLRVACFECGAAKARTELPES